MGLKINKMGRGLRGRLVAKDSCVYCPRNACPRNASRNASLVIFCAILVLLLAMGGCRALLSKKSYYPSFNPPQYVFNSGLLKLERTLRVPSGDGSGTMFFSHNGRYLVATTDKSVHYNIWDLETGDIVHQVNRFRQDDKGRVRIPGRFGRYNHIFGYSPGGMFLPDDSALLLPKSKVYFPVNEKNIAPISEGYHADADYSYFYLDMKNLGKMRPALPADMAQDSWLKGCFSPDGKYFAVPGKTAVLRYKNYGKTSFLKLYRTSDWKLVAELKKGFASELVRFTPDSKYVVDHERVGNDDGKLAGEIEIRSRPDGTRYASAPIKADYNTKLKEYAYPEIRFWSVPDLKLVKTIDNVFRGGMAALFAPKTLSISPNGRLIAMVGVDHEIVDAASLSWKVLVRVFSAKNGKLIHEFDNVVGSVYFTKGNQYLVVMNHSEPTAIRVYSTKDWKLKEHVHFDKDSAWLFANTFNEKSNRLAFSNGPLIYIWKVIEEE